MSIGRDNDIDRAMRRRERWAMKRAASRLLPKEGVANCCKYPVPVKGWNCHDPDQPGIKVCRHRETNQHFYGNLAHCGSIYGCAICAVRITERRKLEIMEIMEKTKGTNIVPYMLTITFRHTKIESLRSLCERLREALKKYFFNRTFWRNYKKRIGMRAFVKVTETTYSDENGWHVHLHMLLFCEAWDLVTGEFFEVPDASVILPNWQQACESAGLGVPDEHGVMVTSHDEVASYVAKWGIENELTKQHVKKGRKGSMSPFDLLRKYTFEHDERAGFLFKEFFYNFKGSRQMIKSRGFNKFFGLQEKEKTDVEIANEPVENADVIHIIPYDDWRVVNHHSSQVEVLEGADSGGAPGIVDVIEYLKYLPSPYAEGWKKIGGT